MPVVLVVAEVSVAAVYVDDVSVVDVDVLVSFFLQAASATMRVAAG